MSGSTSIGMPMLVRALKESRTEDGALSDALTGLLGHLRGRPYGRFFGLHEEALDGVAERFIGRLAEHLRFTEETLFPALREVEPRFERDIETLKTDHRLLRVCAQNLALQLRGGDDKGAYGVVRSFLAVLLDHVHRETEDVDRLVRSLDVLDARRLSIALIDRRRAASREGECQNILQ